MKRKEFIQTLERAGCVLLRNGARHDIWMNPKSGMKQPVPRHAEIDDKLVRHILKLLRLK